MVFVNSCHRHESNRLGLNLPAAWDPSKCIEYAKVSLGI